MAKNQETIENEELEEQIPEIDENGHYIGELGSNVTPFVRMITDIYSKLHYIEEYERRDFAQSLCKPSSNKLVEKINNFLDSFTETKIGALLCILFVKLFARWVARLDYITDEEAMKAKAKETLMKEIYSEISGAA